MRGSMLAFAIVAAAASIAMPTWPQTPAPRAETIRVFNTPLENDPSRVVRMQRRTHPAGAGNPFHTHNGDQWEVVLDGEMTFTIRGQPSRVIKAGENVYIPRGTVHRNENRSNQATHTVELLIIDSDKPQANPAPPE